MSALLLAQEEAEGEAQDEGARHHDPLGCAEERPDEELEGGLLEVLEDEDEAEHHGNADDDELRIVSQGLQSHAPHSGKAWEIMARARRGCQQPCAFGCHAGTRVVA